jgi:hypothetical protein
MLAIDRENTENRIELSKLDEYINFSLTCCSNLHEMWASGDYTQRQELQNTFFEQGIEYNRESSTCRTLETNEFLETVTDLSKDYSKLTPTQLKDFKPSSLGVGKRK